MAASNRVPVSGSERLVPVDARIGDVDPQADVELTVYVRPRAPVDWVDAESARAPALRRLATREDWADMHGASDEDLRAVASFATDAGFTVTDLDSARRAVHLSGPLSAAVDAFEATIEGRYRPADGGAEYRGRSGALSVPAGLGNVVTGVFGIDDRPQGRPQAAPARAGAGRGIVHPGPGGRGVRVPVGRRRAGARPSASSSSAAASTPPTSRPTSRASASRSRP